jgi:hypothetical protein
VKKPITEIENRGRDASLLNIDVFINLSSPHWNLLQNRKSVQVRLDVMEVGKCKAGNFKKEYVIISLKK